MNEAALAHRQLAMELLHLPDKPAGVGRRGPRHLLLATELLHLPGKPAGVGAESSPNHF
jgi:hypothetical protein